MNSSLILSKHSVHIIPAIIIGILIIVITLYANYVAQKMIIKYAQAKKLEPQLILVGKKLTKIILYALGITLFLENLHIQLSALFGTLGVVALGVGFALQQTLANITAGVFLLFFKPFFIGNYIISESPKFEGEIIDINFNVTTLAYKGDHVLIPNYTLYSAIVLVKKNRSKDEQSNT